MQRSFYPKVDGNGYMINVYGFKVGGSNVAELQSAFDALKADHPCIVGKEAHVIKFVGGIGKIVRSEIVTK